MRPETINNSETERPPVSIEERRALGETADQGLGLEEPATGHVYDLDSNSPNPIDTRDFDPHKAAVETHAALAQLDNLNNAIEATGVRPVQSTVEDQGIQVAHRIADSNGDSEKKAA